MKNLTYDSSIILVKKEINYVGFEANYQFELNLTDYPLSPAGRIYFQFSNNIPAGLNSRKDATQQCFLDFEPVECFINSP